MTTKTKLKHTKGPWHIGLFPGPIIYGPQGEQIADMRGGMLPKDETFANSWLIKSAPELLKALLALRKAFYVDGSSKALKAAFELTHEVVKKAEGRI